MKLCNSFSVSKQFVIRIFANFGQQEADKKTKFPNAMDTDKP